MSKPIKNLISETYRRQFADSDGALLIDIRGLEANEVNRLRGGLAEKQMRVTVIKNSLAKKVLQGTELEGLSDMFQGPSAMVYGGESVVVAARELIDWVKELENLDFKGAVMEGTVFGPSEFEALSKYPTREEAQATVVQLVLSPAQNLVGSVLSPGRNLAAIVKTIEEKLEKGEEIQKVG